MTLLTPVEVAAIVPTSLDASVLQGVIDREESEMIRRFGAHADGVTEVSETMELSGADVFTSRPIASLSSIAVVAYIGASPSTLAASQYYLVPPLNQIRIVPFLTQSFVTITYVPRDDRTLRAHVLLDLVRLALEQFSAAGGEVSGFGFSVKASSASAADRAAQREYLYSRLTLQAV